MKWLKDLELRARLLIFLIALNHLALVLITLGNCKRGEPSKLENFSAKYLGP